MPRWIHAQDDTGMSRRKTLSIQMPCVVAGGGRKTRWCHGTHSREGIRLDHILEGSSRKEGHFKCTEYFFVEKEREHCKADRLLVYYGEHMVWRVGNQSILYAKLRSLMLKLWGTTAWLIKLERDIQSSFLTRSQRSQCKRTEKWRQEVQLRYNYDRGQFNRKKQ